MFSVSLFSSSDEEEVEYSTQEINLIRRQLRDHSNIFSIPNTQFVSYFRLSKEAFKYTLDEITHELETRKRSSAVPAIIKLAATMRILVEGSYQKGAGNDYNVGLSQSSVSNGTKECINAMPKKLCPKWISFLMNDSEKSAIKEAFFSKNGFPGVIGCIDGTHVKILAPSITERFKYFNRKGFYSLNATVVCDHKLRIRYISAHHPGSVHDSLVWNVSDIKHLLKDNYLNGETNTWLLGDAGYPLEPYIITPFRFAETGSQERRFNLVHSQTRNVVERSIGVLKNRFRCLLGARQLHYKPEMAGKITSVCAALHNICIHYKLQAPDVTTYNEIPQYVGLEENIDITASNIRRKIMVSLIS